jgi:hypothetical protein
VIRATVRIAFGVTGWATNEVAFRLDGARVAEDDVAAEEDAQAHLAGVEPAEGLGKGCLALPLLLLVPTATLRVVHRGLLVLAVQIAGARGAYVEAAPCRLRRALGGARRDPALVLRVAVLAGVACSLWRPDAGAD